MAGLRNKTAQNFAYNDRNFFKNASLEIYRATTFHKQKISQKINWEVFTSKFAGEKTCPLLVRCGISLSWWQKQNVSMCQSSSDCSVDIIRMINSKFFWINWLRCTTSTHSRRVNLSQRNSELWLNIKSIHQWSTVRLMSLEETMRIRFLTNYSMRK